MVERVYPAGPGYEKFKRRVADLTGVDLDMYKFQIHRRVHTLMRNWGFEEYDTFYDLLHEDPDRRKKFLDYITINVTEFFRNPPRWEMLREFVLPKLLVSGREGLRFWSAGCSSGEEPYSLAILALEAGVDASVLAVDVDEGAIARAKAGVYGEKQLVNVPERLRRRYFRREKEGSYAVSQGVRDLVSFRRANLLTFPFPRDRHLVLCRNVVIYFSAETKRKLYEKFFDCLAPGGFLVVGTTEQIFDYATIGFQQEGSFLYRKPAEGESGIKSFRSGGVAHEAGQGNRIPRQNGK
ncbi:MAG: CheR family methyltransferase [Thermovirgaceae bacterium]